MAQTPKSSSKVEPIFLLRDWLEIKEPSWSLRLETVGSVGFNKDPYYTLSIGNDEMWCSWVDAPHKDPLKMLLWSWGAGSVEIDLKHPKSFDRIHAAAKRTLEHFTKLQ